MTEATWSDQPTFLPDTTTLLRISPVSLAGELFGSSFFGFVPLLLLL